jgi:hypothetical protein
MRKNISSKRDWLLRLTAMLSGQFRGYSVERLMRFLVALGHDVEIVVKPKRRRGTAELRVA